MKVQLSKASIIGKRGAAQRSGRILRRLIVLATVSLLFVVGLEWMVGRFIPVGGQIYELDTQLLFDALPNAARIQPMEREFLKEGDVARVVVRTGAEGYRSGDLDSPKERTRVLVLGDSLVMAENVPEDRTFVRALGRELEARIGEPGSIEMVNAGRSGYGPDQALRLLESRGDWVDPDLVVFVLCAHNDFGDLMRNKLYRLDEAGTLVREAAIVGERVQDVFSKRRAESHTSALLRLWRFWKSSREAGTTMKPLEPGAMRQVARALENEAREHLVLRNPEVVSLFRDVYDIDVAADLPGSFAGAKRDLMTGVLAQTVRHAKEKGIPLVFVVVPSAVDLCSEFGITVDPLQFPGHRKTQLVDALTSSVGLAGGVAIDVTPALLGDGHADRYFVGGTDMHWNVAGQAAGASYVAEELLRDTVAAGALGVEVAR